MKKKFREKLNLVLGQKRKLNNRVVCSTYKQIENNSVISRLIYLILMPLLIVSFIALTITGISLNTAGKNDTIVNYAASNHTDNYYELNPNFRDVVNAETDDGILTWKNNLPTYDWSNIGDATKTPKMHKLFDAFNIIDQGAKKVASNNGIVLSTNKTFVQDSNPTSQLMQKNGIGLRSTTLYNLHIINSKVDASQATLQSPQNPLVNTFGSINIPYCYWSLSSEYYQFDPSKQIFKNFQIGVQNFILQSPDLAKTGNFFRTWWNNSASNTAVPYDKALNTGYSINFNSSSTNPLLSTLVKGLIYIISFSFVLLSIYLFIRYKWYNGLSFMVSMIISIPFIIGGALLSLPISPITFAIIGLGIIWLLFKIIIFISQTNKITQQYFNEENYLKFSRKQEIFDIFQQGLKSMRRFFIFETAITLISLALFTILLAFPQFLEVIGVFKGSSDTGFVKDFVVTWHSIFPYLDYSSWWHVTLLCIIVICCINIAFFFIFIPISRWITFRSINAIKVFNINASLNEKEEVEQEFEMINKSRLTVDTDKLREFNPELFNAN